MITEYRAAHAGSLLRPPWLPEAREARKKGTWYRDGKQLSPEEVPADGVAASMWVPQCGFASGSRDDERRKLGLVVSTASRVWG